jgi:hypothetical protein
MNFIPFVHATRMQGDVKVIDFSSITSMYGSVHCASQVVRRVPRRFLGLANGAPLALPAANGTNGTPGARSPLGPA